MTLHTQRLTRRSHTLMTVPNRSYGQRWLLFLPLWLAITLTSVTAYAWPTMRSKFTASAARNTTGANVLPDEDALGLNLADQLMNPLEQQPSMSPIFTPEVQAWEPEIIHWSRVYKISPNLIATVMQIESCGYPEAVSNAGAIGLFQVMPFHFAADENPSDPETNASRGLSYLARSIELAKGDLRLSLAGYNGGHGMIFNASGTWPEETKRYVSWGLGILADVLTGSESSPHLASWLNSGGSILCERAAEALDLEP